MSSISEVKPATVEDLARVEGKAELIGGRIVHEMATGHRPNVIAGEIFFSLKLYIRADGAGFAYTDNMGFVVDGLPSGRESFSPDAAYYDGPLPDNLMRFVRGYPAFAVEVRSENDYGPAAERELAAKRADYFAAGTRVVWDVDPEAESVRSFHAELPERPDVFRRGQVADAEPAVPGWRLAVDEVFG